MFSSTVTTSRCSDAAHDTVSKSSGLTQRALTTLAETPCAARISAAVSHIGTVRPTPRSATSVPRERIWARRGLPGDRLGGYLDAASGTSGIADRDGPLGVQRGVQRLGQLSLIGRSKHHHVGDRAQVAQVEDAVVRRPVLADKPGAVEAEHHVQVLQRDVHDHLVIGALHERRVDGDHRQKAADGQPGCHADRVLLGDSDVVEAIRELLGETCRDPCLTAWPR